MFIPIVPFVPHTTVINKTIVYSDTILPLKDTGNNLKVTSINDVSEFSLENCLKIIFESNPNVVFNTIQYSKKDKKVYFYTNQEISIKQYEESKITKYEPISSRLQILEEVKGLMTTNKIKNSDCVSIHDVAVLLFKMRNKYQSIMDSCNIRVRDLIKQEFGRTADIIIYSFDYDSNELKIGFKYIGDDYDKITFIKKDGDLFITKSKSYYDKKVLAVIGTELSQLYDDLIKYSDYKNDYIFNVRPVNSKFLVDITSSGVSIYTKLPTNIFTKEFNLKFPSYDDEYKYDCNSTILIEAFWGNENEIFKRIFVKIEDCPKWSQETLYEIRQKQLVEEQKIEDKIKYKEMKKQKRLELTRRFFPFLKK